jgi:hypothetical protein
VIISGRKLTVISIGGTPGVGHFFQQAIQGISRSLAKHQSIRQVLQHPVMNNGLVTIHRYDPGNIGDFYCAPHHYFPVLHNTHLDISDYKRDDPKQRQHWIEAIGQSSLIVGGGGLLNRDAFAQQMVMFEKLARKGKKIVLWGLGHNIASSKDPGRLAYNIDTSVFGLVGVRDAGRREEWVPCVSCMHPIFDKRWSDQREIGIVFHKKTLSQPKVLQQFSHFPSTANNAVFEDVIEFIAGSETLLTDSYHAMYWALLLGKKVMVFPNSSKFFHFKYAPVISAFDSYQKDMHKLTSYTGVLEDCRERNRLFAQRAWDYLGVSG